MPSGCQSFFPTEIFPSAVHPRETMLWARKLTKIQKLKTDKLGSFDAVKQRLSKSDSALCRDRPGELLGMEKAFPDSTRMAPGKPLYHPINDECVNKE